MSGDAPIVFIDTETTGLSPEAHEVWEIGLIAANDQEYEFRLRPKALHRAEPTALRLTRFYDRIAAAGGATGFFTTDLTRNQIAWEVARLTAGRHLVGAVPSFDAAFLEVFLRSEGYTPAWHYHLIDVETLIAGWVAEAPPWDSDALSRAVGVDPAAYERHTAIGDARWVRDLYRVIEANR